MDGQIVGQVKTDKAALPQYSGKFFAQTVKLVLRKAVQWIGVEGFAAFIADESQCIQTGKHTLQNPGPLAQLRIRLQQR